MALCSAAGLVCDKVRHLVYIDVLEPQLGENFTDIVIRRHDTELHEETDIASSPPRESMASRLFPGLASNQMNWDSDRFTLHS